MALSPNYGSRALIDAPSPWTPEQLADLKASRDASLLATAVDRYGQARMAACLADKHDDPVSAWLHRADARAALHGWPGVLAILEPDTGGKDG